MTPFRVYLRAARLLRRSHLSFIDLMGEYARSTNPDVLSAARFAQNDKNAAIAQYRYLFGDQVAERILWIAETT